MNRALGFNRALLICVAVAAVVMPVLYAAQTSAPDASQSSTKHAQAQHSAAPPQSDGERIFQRNCARCHTAPDGFSPRISGTIVRHMRIRANLSEHDERELLRFFNP